jgi:hypothetical protein
VKEMEGKLMIPEVEEQGRRERQSKYGRAGPSVCV